MNSRSQMNQNKNNEKERLDTVHQNNSEVSVKEFVEENKDIDIQEGTFRKKKD
jgi:hypothetical protein